MRFPDPLKIALLCLALVVLSLWLQGDIGLVLADEGYLWYGAVQTAKGSVPVRDFQSYDPGRYYWAAAWLRWSDHGIMSLRASVAAFQFLGLTLGLLALRQVVRSWWALAIAAFVLLLWMVPRYKVFESSLAMASVFFASCLVRNPSVRQHLVCGIFVGVAACFGRNHGVYNLLAFFALIVFMRLKLDHGPFLKRAGAWAVGIVLGYSPLLMMLLVVPGFFEAFLESVAYLLRRGATNITLPIRWPWSYDYPLMDFVQSVKAFCLGTWFLLMPMCYGGGAVWLVLTRRQSGQRRAVLIASVVVGMFYSHHAFSRADVWHLAESVHPLLIGLLAAPWWVILLVLTLVSAGTTSQYYRRATSPAYFVEHDIAGDRLWIPKPTASTINSVKQVIDKHLAKGEDLMIAPRWPTLYPILGREAPVWDIYFLLPQTDSRQKRLIEDLESHRVDWVIVSDAPVNERDDLRFSNAYHLVWRHFRNHFVQVEARLPREHVLLRRKSAGD